VDRAVQERVNRPVTAIPELQRIQRPLGSIHPALCAALSSIARARALAIHESAVYRENGGGELRDGTIEATQATRMSRSALRAAVTDYVKQLRAAKVALDEVLTIVHDAIADCATAVGAEAAIPGLLLESEEWTRQAFTAA
jgi:hypothetical protein